MAEQRRIGYRWNLRQLMAQRNLWKTTELLPLLKARGINLSNAQVHRLVTGTPERIPAQTFAALCDILECTPNDLFEPYVQMRAAKTANAPKPEGQGLNDLYVRFYRIAERVVTEREPTHGIVCYITNYSWLDGRSHTGMRERFLGEFDQVEFVRRPGGSGQGVCADAQGRGGRVLRKMACFRRPGNLPRP